MPLHFKSPVFIRRILQYRSVAIGTDTNNPISGEEGTLIKNLRDFLDQILVFPGGYFQLIILLFKSAAFFL